MKYVATFFLSLILTIPLMANENQVITVDNQKSKIGFDIIKFKIGGKVEGQFQSFSGTANYNPTQKTLSDVHASVDVKSVNTGNYKRDQHLINDPSFFNIAKHPYIIIKNKNPIKLNKEINFVGTITLNGKTKDVPFKGKVLEQNDKQVKVSLSSTINRLDFDVTWNKPMEKGAWKTVLGVLGKTVLDEKVNLNLDLVGKVNQY